MSQDALIKTYARANIQIERGDGCWLYDLDGKAYLDFASGVATNCVGHAHPHLVKAIQDQAATLMHSSNLYRIPQQERLAERLVAATFADAVFFCNSGTEAAEGAVKSARRFHAQKGQPERYRILTFEGAFHGRTLAMIAAGNQPKHLEGFGPKVDGFDQVPFGDHEALRAAITDQTAAIMIEPIQGEGGIRVVPNECLKGLRALCDAEGLLLIFDEIQTGIGRTGTFLGHEAAGIAPDIAALAKGLGGGFPVGAVLATQEVAAAMTAGSHGSTFGGNPLAMAAGNAVLDIVLDEGFLQSVRDKSLRLKQKLVSLLDTHPTIFKEVRGRGFHLGLQCHVPVGDVIAAAQLEGLLAAPAGDNVMRILPPLIAGEAEFDLCLSRLEAAAQALEMTTAAE